MQPNQPTPEQQGAPTPKPEQPSEERRVETAPAHERAAPSGDQAAQGDAAYTNLPLPQPVTQPAEPVDNNQPPATSSSGPAIADDVDLIEKEWVDKAKSIVHEYKHDPHNQEKEVGQLKADYQQKRYGKTIKTSE